MSNLKQKLNSDLAVNLKARNELETTTLRNVIGEIQRAEKSGKTAVEFTDADVLDFLNREVKKRRETAKEFATVGAVERATRETAEADFLSAYLPAPLTSEQLATIVDEAIAEVGATDVKAFGQVMKLVTAKTKNQADGKVISELVRSKLN